jgi:hypothetical protein
VRKQAPGTAAPHHIEDRVEDLAQRVQPGPTDAFWLWEKRVEASKLRVREIGQVGPPQGQTPAILPGKPAHVPVFRQFLVGHA